MINVMVSDPFVSLIDEDKLVTAAQAVLEHASPPVDGDLSVVIDDDDHLRQLNHDFLGIDSPTDVLSFPSGEETADPETGRVYLGDVIVSYPRAVEQAGSAGHPPFDELQLLVIHGTLHLLGHDHAEPEEKERMWGEQSAILSRLNVNIKRLPE